MLDPQSFRITQGQVADLSMLETLWLAIHHVHAASMPELAPYVSDEVSWRERRDLYEELFRKPDTFLLLAWFGTELVGYALGHVLSRGEAWARDTWSVGDRVGELESISVAPEHRGVGVGSALLDAVDVEFAQRNVVDQIVGALPGNAATIRLYMRRGYLPTWLYLSRFAGRD